MYKSRYCTSGHLIDCDEDVCLCGAPMRDATTAQLEKLCLDSMEMMFRLKHARQGAE